MNITRILIYNNVIVPIIGECYHKCQASKYKKAYKFLVTTLDSFLILGLEACN